MIASSQCHHIKKKGDFIHHQEDLLIAEAVVYDRKDHYIEKIIISVIQCIVQVNYTLSENLSRKRRV